MADKCWQCKHLNQNDTYKEWFSDKTKYKCKEKCEYRELEADACYRFDALRDTGSYTPSGCFITTIVCEVLGYSDDCELLQRLRDFRDIYLKKNPKYFPLLIKYDQVGPLICEGIRNEANNYSFCLGLMKYFLIPAVNYIKEGQFENAIEAYENMVYHLNDEFSLPEIIIDENKEINLETLGKGRILQKPSEA